MCLKSCLGVINPERGHAAAEPNVMLASDMCTQEQRAWGACWPAAPPDRANAASTWCAASQWQSWA